MESIRINGKDFVPYITNEKILAAVDKVAAELNNDFFGSGVTPLMLCVLNGSIIFCGHLLPRLKFSCELASIRLKSYEGTKSTGDIKEVIGLDVDLKGRTVVIIEDIVDTGATIESLVGQLIEKGAADVRVCTFSLKSDVYKRNIKIDYVDITEDEFNAQMKADTEELAAMFAESHKLEHEIQKQLANLKFVGK